MFHKENFHATDLDLHTETNQVDGHLYYIRRPYEVSHFSPRTALLDLVLFPFRLLRAVFHFLNFFSLVYSRKPLTTASGPKLNHEQQFILLLKDKLIEEVIIA